MSMLGQNTARPSDREYEKNNGFVSAVIAVGVGPVATALWAVGVACINNPSGVPADGRTSDDNTTIYTIKIENATGAAVTAWLEDEDGTHITTDFHLNNNETIVVNYSAGMNFGDMDIYINASVAAVEAQIMGTEE